MRASAALTALALSAAVACSESSAPEPTADERPQATASGQTGDAAGTRRDSTPATPPRSDTARATPSRPDSSRLPADTLPPGNGVISGVTFVEVPFTVTSGDSAGMRAVRLERIGGVRVRMYLQTPRGPTTSSVELREVASAASSATGDFTLPAQPDGIYVLRAVPPAGSSHRPLDASVQLYRGRIGSPWPAYVVLRPQ
jgi:hypothetical protein